MPIVINVLCADQLFLCPALLQDPQPCNTELLQLVQTMWSVWVSDTQVLKELSIWKYPKFQKNFLVGIRTLITTLAALLPSSKISSTNSKYHTGRNQVSVSSSIMHPDLDVFTIKSAWWNTNLQWTGPDRHLLIPPKKVLCIPWNHISR